MASIHTITTGARVTGSYIGVPVSGTVTSHRPHTMNHRIELFTVALDAPTEILGLVRDSVILSCSDDMDAASRYVGGQTPDTIAAVGKAVR
jgi:hypothetical protein